MLRKDTGTNTSLYSLFSLRDTSCMGPSSFQSKEMRLDAPLRPIDQFVVPLSRVVKVTLRSSSCIKEQGSGNVEQGVGVAWVWELSVGSILQQVKLILPRQHRQPTCRRDDSDCFGNAENRHPTTSSQMLSILSRAADFSFGHFEFHQRRTRC